MGSPLARLLSEASKVPVSVVLGKAVGTGGTIATNGSRITTYLRVGGVPANGERCVILRAGSKTVVFTGVTVIG